MLTIDATGDNSNTAGSGIIVSNAAGTTINANVGLGANQTWTVGSGAALTVNGAITDFGVGYSLTKDGTGSLTLTGANTFSGGLTLKAGTVTVGYTTAAIPTLGSGTVTLGDSTGNANVTLNANASTWQATFANPISVASGNTGTATIGALNQWTTTFSGPITLHSHDLVLQANAVNNGGLKTTGAITSDGTGGNLTLNGNNSLGGNWFGGYMMIDVGTSINISGTITRSGTGTSVTKISGNIGANVTSVIQNAPGGLFLTGNNSSFVGSIWVKNSTLGIGSATALGGASSLKLGDDSVANSNAVQFRMFSGVASSVNITLADRVTYTGTITIGSGDGSGPTYGGIITGNNDFVLGGLNNQAATTTLSGTINNNGTVSNTDSINTPGYTISGTLGANVTGVIQNSAVAPMTLSGDNPFAGTALVSAGTLRLNQTNTLKNATLDTGTSGAQQVTFVAGGTRTYNLGGLAGADDLAISTNSIAVRSRLAPGRLGVGTLTVTGTGAVTLGTGVTVEIEVGGGMVDRLDVPAGTLVLPATATVTVSGTGTLPSPAVILSAATLTGDVTGWTVTPGYKVKKDGNTVILEPKTRGAIIIVQ